MSALAASKFWTDGSFGISVSANPQGHHTPLVCLGCVHKVLARRREHSAREAEREARSLKLKAERAPVFEESAKTPKLRQLEADAPYAWALGQWQVVSVDGQKGKLALGFTRWGLLSGHVIFHHGGSHGSSFSAAGHELWHSSSASEDFAAFGAAWQRNPRVDWAQPKVLDKGSTLKLSAEAAPGPEYTYGSMCNWGATGEVMLQRRERAGQLLLKGTLTFPRAFGSKPRDYHFTAFPPGVAADRDMLHNKASIHAKAERERKAHQERKTARRERMKRLGMPLEPGESSDSEPDHMQSDSMW